MSKPGTGTYSSWDIINENTAVKHCDLSFFEHRGSGVPKEILWFFDAEELLPGVSQKVGLTYMGRQYYLLVTCGSSGGAVRIFWPVELSNLLRQYKYANKPMAVYTRISPKNYKLEMKENITVVDISREKLETYESKHSVPVKDKKPVEEKKPIIERQKPEEKKPIIKEPVDRTAKESVTAEELIELINLVSGRPELLPIIHSIAELDESKLRVLSAVMGVL